MGKFIETIDFLFSQDKPSDMVALYMLYCNESIKQKTKHPNCKMEYTEKMLGLSITRIRRAKKRLRDLGIIQTYTFLDFKPGVKHGHFIEILR